MSTAEAQNGVNTNLQKQDLSNLDISKLTPLSPEVISRQATINIGTIGHVAHGKSTVVKAISGVQTVRFKNELERNITIKLERLSQKRVHDLIKSANLLREYELREKARLRRLANERRQQQWHLRNINYDDVRRLTYVPPILRGNSTSPSSGYESLNDNASSYSGEYYNDNNDEDNHLSAITHTPKSQVFKRLHKTKSKATLTQSLQLRQQQRKQTASKRRLSNSPPTSNNTPISKRQKIDHIEYIVESIESLESINSMPVFFVKWLNYPAEQNTWESLANLSECTHLEPFIEQRYAFFELIIAAISAELELEIEQQSLAYDTKKLNVRELDEYEPLLLKADLILLAQFREASSRNQREPEKIRKRVLDMLLLKPFYYLRKQQLIDLSAWEQRMNSVESVAPIKLENYVDLEVPDSEFTYIKESFPGAGVSIATDPPIGCKCVDACTPSSKCCARMADSYFAYDKNGRLRIRTGEAIYECNSKCICDDTCVNRVIQRGRNNALCLFKTATGCGWGVRTESSLRKGEYVCEYVGEIINCEEANERGKKYDAIGRTYLFDLDYNTTAESVYTIDAALHGNVSHFINHSCDPNVAVFPFWINNLDINMPRLAFFSLRSIKAGEELTFDYIRTDMGADDYNNLSEAEKVTCRCGASNCRKVLF